MASRVHKASIEIDDQQAAEATFSSDFELCKSVGERDTVGAEHGTLATLDRHRSGQTAELQVLQVLMVHVRFSPPLTWLACEHRRRRWWCVVCVCGGGADRKVFFKNNTHKRRRDANSHSCETRLASLDMTRDVALAELEVEADSVKGQRRRMSVGSQ